MIQKVAESEQHHGVAAIFYVFDLSLTSSCTPLLHQSHFDTLKNDLICVDIYIPV